MENKGLISRLWSGELPLPVTYWVFLVIPNVIFGIIIRMIEISGNISLNSFTMFVLVIICWQIFMYIAVWKSANNYQGAVIWRILAKCMVVLGCLASLGSLGNLLRMWN